jgi:NAD(P)-dependent dehydrogenase (short-subunit alcohol dehydrogenase family)
VASSARDLNRVRRDLEPNLFGAWRMAGLTRMLADELRSDGVLVNAVCPGWTATDMGGGGRPVPEGARSITWACLLPDDGPTGGFFRAGEPLPW